MVNKVTLIGRLGKNPEIRTLEAGTCIAKFTLATDESYKDKSGQWQTTTEWHNLILWGKVAEYAEKSLKKGDLVYVEGKLTSRSWQDEHGVTKYITEVRVETFRLLKGGANSDPLAEGEKKDSEQEVISIPKDNEDDLPF